MTICIYTLLYIKHDHVDVFKNTHTCNVIKQCNCCDFPYLMASKICIPPHEELVADDLNAISKFWFNCRALFIYNIYIHGHVYTGRCID